ncbi:MAG: tetratricopeptide (TPR) repeat protein [Pseudohongiellaceae bacterium]|jgi:tetratricopeptide (TPR) repeat protein
MSLLMDALRKAEQAKKQAEQEKTTGDKSPQVATAAPGDEVVSPSLAKPSSPDLGIMVEFEEDPRVAQQALTSAAETAVFSADLDEAIETASLSLEANTPSTPASETSLGKSLDNASLPAKSDNENELEAFFDAEASASSIKSTSAAAGMELPVAPAADQEKAVPNHSSQDRPVESINYAAPSGQAEPNGPPIGSSRAGRGSEPQQARGSITQRTAKSRQSAKSVFAAKKIGANNRQNYIYGGAGIAAALILGIGYFLLSSNSSNNSFSIPETNYVSSSEPDFAGEISGDIERNSLAPAFSEEESSSVAPESLEPTVESFVASAAIEQLQNAGLLEQSDAQNVTQRLTGLSVTSMVDLASQAMSVQLRNSDPDEVTIENRAPTVALQSAPSLAAAPTGNASAAQGRESELAAVEDGFNLGASLKQATSEPRVALISFRKKESRPTLSPLLTTAYAAYQAGDFESASTFYEQVLQAEPRNIDAMLGLAAISSASGEIAAAMNLYSSVLALNPSQAIARSGLLNLVPSVNPAEKERQLRRLNNDFPNVAPLAFALGNFYAGESRWTDAQKYYFKALSLAKADSVVGVGVSPDYAFNLAVSLDRLNQPRSAISFYQEALAGASQFPSNFDLDTARDRIAKLTGSETP